MSEISRRVFLKLTGAATAVAAAEMVSKDYYKLIPYVIPPEQTRPGVWSAFATTCRECPAGCGMHVRHRDGRVTKAEGNPGHPVNRGGLCPRGQSSLQGLYDPDRVQVPQQKRDKGFVPIAWADALEAIGRRIAAAKGKVVVLSDLQNGTLGEVMAQFGEVFGKSKPLYFEPFSYDAQRAAHQRLFGMGVIPDYHLADCEMILSLAGDFLEVASSPVGLARDFAHAHSYRDQKMGRFVYVGPYLSMTAANGDDFVQVRPGAEGLIGLAMVDTIIRRGWARGDVGDIAAMVESFDAKTVGELCGVKAERIVAMARAFVQAKASVAMGGPANGAGPLAEQTAMAAALLNQVAGRIGQTVDFSRPHALSQTATHEQVRRSLAELGSQDVLVIHNANPVFSMADVAGQLRKAGLVVCLGTMLDETAQLAHWVLPIDSPLEAWGDYDSCSGVHSLMQPTMARLYDTRGAGDVFLALAETAGRPLKSARESSLKSSAETGASSPVGFEAWLGRRWQDIGLRVAPTRSLRSFDEFWRDALRAGGVWESPAAVAAPLQHQLGQLGKAALPAAPSQAQAELWLRPSILFFDGRVANRGWLQEAPDPMAYATWGSWIDIHTQKAAALGIGQGDVIELTSEQGVAVEAPARVSDHLDPNVVAVALGQGHTALGRNAAGRGFNGFSLVGARPAGGLFGRVTIRKTGKNISPAYAAFTQEQHHRDILQWVGLGELREMKKGQGDKLILPLPEGYRRGKDIYPPREYKEHRWAMVVDLQRCIGCGACAVACYAENNLAVGGEHQVRRAQETPWLQIVPYMDQSDAGRVGFLPMLCQQCDAAPCEPVCPVYASVHNEEGLNLQVYNRCIGTRYCSNNCPYKVRRFNWLNYTWEKPLDMQLNPEVTVRERGVMEKCTFCIQRIREVQYRARREGRAVRDQEVQPACVQSCPTRAYTFGDLLDEESEVSKLTRQDNRRYHVLENLNTKPAITYLRRIRNEPLGQAGDNNA